MSFLFLANAPVVDESVQAELSRLEICGMTLAGLGLLFFLGAAVGLFRFPDFYTRMHAAAREIRFPAYSFSWGSPSLPSMTFPPQVGS